VKFSEFLKLINFAFSIYDIDNRDWNKFPIRKTQRENVEKKLSMPKISSIHSAVLIELRFVSDTHGQTRGNTASIPHICLYSTMNLSYGAKN